MRHPFGGPGRGGAGHRNLHDERAAYNHREHPRDRLENLLFEQQMGIFMNRMQRDDANEEAFRHREILPDPSDKQFDEIILAFTVEVDQDLQDKEILQPK